LNSFFPHVALVLSHSTKYGSGNFSQLFHSESFIVDPEGILSEQIYTSQSWNFTVSQGNQIILLIYGEVFHGATNTITSPLSNVLKR
jgi:hypothetical protein